MMRRKTFLNIYNMLFLEGGNFMKKILINYYALIMMISFIVYNVLFTNIRVAGFLYHIGMILLIILNVVALIRFRSEIKCKSFLIVMYALIWLFSKDIYQCIFDFSNITFLCIIGFKSNFIKVITILFAVIVIIFFLPLSFIFIILFVINPNGGRNDIYEDTHYYCDNNMEAYAYSLGAMDKYHYSVGKHYEILFINDIIKVTYDERNEVGKKQYDDYIKNHDCSLEGDINGFK